MPLEGLDNKAIIKDVVVIPRWPGRRACIGKSESSTARGDRNEEEER